MKQTAKTNHHDTRAFAGSKIGLFFVTNVSDEKYGVTSGFVKNHGVTAIAVACSDYSSNIVEHPVKVSLRTLTGSKPRSFAVRIMVMMIETLCFPRFVVFPKVILRKKTAFLRVLSVKLFVGKTIGNLRKTNSSFSKLTSRLRILSALWRVSGSWTSSLRNRLRMSFLSRLFFVGKYGVLMMKGNSIFNKLFQNPEKLFRLGMVGKFFVKQFVDIPQQVRQTFLLGERACLGEVGAPEIGNKYSVVVFPEAVDDHLGATAFLNMKEGDIRINENPKPVTFPTGFVSMNEPGFPQGLFKSIVNWFGFFRKFIVKSDQRTRRQTQVPETLHGKSRTVIRGFDLIAHKRSLGSGVRADKGVGDFIFAPTVNDAFTIGTPEITMHETSGFKFTVLKVFLDVFRCVVAWRNIFAAAMRTDIKVNIDGFINMIWIAAKPSRMTNWSAELLRIFRRFFLWISVERSLERCGKLCFKLRVGFFKLFNPGLKSPDLVIGKIHPELKLINSFMQISPFGKHAVRIFAMKKYTKPFEWTIRFTDAFARVEMVVVSLISQCKMSESIVDYVNTIMHIWRKLRIRMGGIQYNNIGYELCQYSF